MKQHTLGPNETETSASNVADRLTKFDGQHWDRVKSLALAQGEGIDFSDEHWSVIIFMRNYYLEHGLPVNAGTTARALNKRSSSRGGNRYLRHLFRDRPVTQGSRLANLRTPAYATDPSFGASY